VLEHFGNHTVAGSTSRGGMRAMLELKRRLIAGSPVGFALDGPRGPARVAQPGAAWLAAATGHPILPFHAEASASWEVSSWDRTQVPRPFSTVAIVLGRPLTLEGRSKTDDQALDRVLRQSATRATEMLTSKQ
jgi:lysophospholipid acyltransferase (LPLAT)-like uncharacterized protein